MINQPLSSEEIELITNYRTLNAQYWSYQKRYGVRKWLKQIHAVENFWVSETMRRKRKPLDIAVASAVRRRFCDGQNVEPDIRGIVFMVMLEIWQKPGLVHLIKFRNGWTERAWPLRDPAKAKHRASPERRERH